MTDNSNPVVSAVLTVFALVVFCGIPFLIASAAGWVAWTRQRRVLGMIIIAGALFAIAIPLYLDRLATERLVAQGVVADSPGFIFLPWMYGVPYGVFASVFASVFMLLVKRRPA